MVLTYPPWFLYFDKLVKWKCESKSLNYIKPTMAMCLVWANRAYEKMKAKKNMFKKKPEDLYMRGEDEEMAALMPDYYAGKFKTSYDPEYSWSKGQKRANRAKK